MKKPFEEFKIRGKKVVVFEKDVYWFENGTIRFDPNYHSCCTDALLVCEIAFREKRDNELQTVKNRFGSIDSEAPEFLQLIEEVKMILGWLNVNLTREDNLPTTRFELMEL